jgi:nitrogen fixation/metabolism regulation signal transduction histidine kinase
MILAGAAPSNAEAKRLVREQRFAEAIQLFQSVPKDLKDTAKAVKSALQLQARIAAGRRAQTVTNLIFITIGLIMLMAAAMAALARLLH